MKKIFQKIDWNSVLGVVAVLSFVWLMQQDLKSDLKSEVGDLRDEVRGEISDLRDEVRDEISDLRDEISDLRSEVHDFRVEMGERVAKVEERLETLASADARIKQVEAPSDTVRVAIVDRSGSGAE